MGRLKALPPALPSLRPSLAYAPENERQYDRDRAQTWRRWYSTPEWRALRQQVFVRDRFICQATGVLLAGKHPAPDSPVADHKMPHRGDRALFFDPANVWTVSKAYHDGEKQRQEHAL